MLISFTFSSSPGNPRIKKATSRLVLAVLALGVLPANAEDYFVDFDSGDNSNAGTEKSKPWKQAPGDPLATGKPLELELQPGDQIFFKGGVRYRGQIEANASGTADEQISYIGNAWGDSKAIIDGSEPLKGWKRCENKEDAQGNPNFASIFKVTVETTTPFALNLHETPVGGDSASDEFLWISQEPNPDDRYFYDRRVSFRTLENSSLSRDGLSDPSFLKSDKTESHLGASVLVWVNPNKVVRREIMEHSLKDGEIEFNEELASNAIYSNGRDHFYALYNSIGIIDTPGEYATKKISESKYEVYLWPRNQLRMEERVSFSARKNGVQLRGESYVTIRGFEITKFAGDGLRDGRGICSDSNDDFTTGLQLLENTITHNLHSGGGGYGGIHLSRVEDTVIADNYVARNVDNKGIFISRCKNTEIRNNVVEYPGGTAIGIYVGETVRILGNTIDKSLSTHANGITLYIACDNVLVAGNKITNCTTPITFQDSGNLYFVNNFIDGGGEFKGPSEWGSTSRGPWATGDIIFWNNTFVGAASSAALNLGKNKMNDYIVQNNILAGLRTGDVDWDDFERSDNLYLEQSFQQASKYDWELSDGEVEDVDPALLFVDPEDGTYVPLQSSPASGTGADLRKAIEKLDVEGLLESFGASLSDGKFNIGSALTPSGVESEDVQTPSPPQAPTGLRQQ